jgi:hypothetical protein
MAGPPGALERILTIAKNLQDAPPFFTHTIGPDHLISAKLKSD